MAYTGIKLSVVVPAYNSEKFILECLDSIRAQEIDGYECIVVDDGSTDNTGKICDGYAKKNPQFKVIHQKNAGVSTARNKGIEAALGEFITFVDADDLVALGAYKKALQRIKEESCDVYSFGIADYKGTADISLYDFKEEEFQDMFIKYPVYMNHVCNKIFKKELLEKNGILFDPEIRTSEDLLVSYKALALSKKTIYANEPDYLYRDNEFSVTHIYMNITTKRFRSDENAAVVKNLLDFSKKHKTKAKKLAKYLELRDALSYIVDYSPFSVKDYKSYAPGIKIWTYSFVPVYIFVTVAMSLNLSFLVHLFHILQGAKRRLKKAEKK